MRIDVPDLMVVADTSEYLREARAEAVVALRKLKAVKKDVSQRLTRINRAIRKIGNEAPRPLKEIRPILDALANAAPAEELEEFYAWHRAFAAKHARKGVDLKALHLWLSRLAEEFSKDGGARLDQVVLADEKLAIGVARKCEQPR